MSLIPMLLPDWREDLEHPHQIFDQNVGLGIEPDQLFHPNPVIRSLMALQARDEMLSNLRETGMPTVIMDKDKFQMILNVQQFKPKEINVSVADRYVIIKANHEEKRDEHGWISRQFVRKCMIPQHWDIDQVSPCLSSDGMLIITAPRKPQDMPKPQNERALKIQETGKPANQDKKKKKKDDQ